jgi:protein O-GlcNAc transferase
MAFKSKAGRSKRQNTQTQPSVAALWRELRRDPTQVASWLALATIYARRDLPWQAGYAARQCLRLNPAKAATLQTLALPANWRDRNLGDSALGRSELPEAATLAEHFRQELQAQPGDWLTALYALRLEEMPSAVKPQAQQSGAARSGAGARHWAEGEAIAAVSALEPIAGESLHWLGVWRLQAGEAGPAVAALSPLVDVQPLRHGSMMVLGEALLKQGHIRAAETAFTRASLSNHPDFLVSLAHRVYAHNYWQEAIGVLKKAQALRPSDVDIPLALARIQSEVYDLADCRQSLARVLELQPNNAEAVLLQAGLLGRMGDARGHFQTVHQAYESGGDPLSRMASSVAMTALYHDGLSPQFVADLHRRVCAPIEAAYTPHSAFSNDKSATRVLRVGLVSGDFHRQHPVNIFMLPLLKRLNPQALEVFVYHTGTMFDEYTVQAKACARRWMECQAMDDPTLQKAILSDHIDILLDLAGHTSSHRLGVFAMRAAPVQATFLGYPHSTGMSRLDWLVGDANVSPEAYAPMFSEGIAQLPGSVFCWAPVDAYPLPPARAGDAPLVLGSFNNAMKLSDTTLALWAQVMHALPHAQLLLKAPSLRDPAVIDRFAARLGEHGIGRERLQFRGPTGLSDMMQEYGDMDIALDPTPYNGGTTTLQALWMGVPVITLEGHNFVSRMGASFLRSMGRHEWVASDEQAYVRAVCNLAADSLALRQSRAALRQHMAASPVCDISTYAGHFERLLRRMWQVYVSGGGTRFLAAQAVENP